MAPSQRYLVGSKEETTDEDGVWCILHCWRSRRIGCDHLIWQLACRMELLHIRSMWDQRSVCNSANPSWVGFTELHTLTAMKLSWSISLNTLPIVWLLLVLPQIMYELVCAQQKCNVWISTTYLSNAQNGQTNLQYKFDKSIQTLNFCWM